MKQFIFALFRKFCESVIGIFFAAWFCKTPDFFSRQFECFYKIYEMKHLQFWWKITVSEKKQMTDWNPSSEIEINIWISIFFLITPFVAQQQPKHKCILTHLRFKERAKCTPGLFAKRALGFLSWTWVGPTLCGRGVNVVNPHYFQRFWIIISREFPTIFDKSHKASTTFSGTVIFCVSKI